MKLLVRYCYKKFRFNSPTRPLAFCDCFWLYIIYCDPRKVIQLFSTPTFNELCCRYQRKRPLTNCRIFIYSRKIVYSIISYIILNLQNNWLASFWIDSNNNSLENSSYDRSTIHWMFIGEILYCYGVIFIHRYPRINHIILKNWIEYNFWKVNWW